MPTKSAGPHPRALREQLLHARLRGGWGWGLGWGWGWGWLGVIANLSGNGGSDSLPSS
jgi:hypothetical protein